MITYKNNQGLCINCNNISRISCFCLDTAILCLLSSISSSSLASRSFFSILNFSSSSWILRSSKRNCFSWNSTSLLCLSCKKCNVDFFNVSWHSLFLIGPPVLDGDMVGDRNGLIVIGVDDDEEEDDKVGEGNGIGSNVVDGRVEDIDVATDGSSIITSKVSEMFSGVTFLICSLAFFCALELMPLLERLNSLCKSCTICRSRSFSLYCSSVPDL